MIRKLLLVLVTLAAILAVAFTFWGISFWRQVVTPMRVAAADLKTAAATFASIPESTLAAAQPVDDRACEGFRNVTSSMVDSYMELARSWADAKQSPDRTPLASMRWTASFETGLVRMVAHFVGQLKASGLGSRDYKECAIAAHSALHQVAEADPAIKPVWVLAHEGTNPMAVAADLAEFFRASRDREEFETARVSPGAAESFIAEFRRMPPDGQLVALEALEMTPLLIRLANGGSITLERPRR